MTKDYRNEPDYFTQGFECKGVVSVWAGMSSEGGRYGNRHFTRKLWCGLL